jgi:hypothetical protein
MQAAVITASASIIVAVLLLFILNQRALLRQERREARLERLSTQLQDLYGPLNALTDINERIYNALRESQPPMKTRRPTGISGGMQH